MQGEGAPAKGREVDDGALGFAGGIAEGDGDVGAGLGESEGGGTAEAAGAAGDEAGFAAQRLGIESEHGGILLRSSYSDREGAVHALAGVIFFLSEGAVVAIESRRAGVSPGRGLFAQGLSSLRSGEGESYETLPPRRFHLARGGCG